MRCGEYVLSTIRHGNGKHGAIPSNEQCAIKYGKLERRSRNDVIRCEYDAAWYDPEYDTEWFVR